MSSYKKIAISILVILVCGEFASAATKCGDATWWPDIQSSILGQLISDDGDAQGFTTFKTKYDVLEATLVTDTHPVTKGFCKGYFTVGTDKSCCQDPDYSKYIHQLVRATIRAAVPPKKADPCSALKDGFFRAFSTCAANKKVSGSFLPPSGSMISGSMPSGSMTSGSMHSGSMASGSMASGSMASGSMASGQMHSGQMHSGSMISGSMPSGSASATGSASGLSGVSVSISMKSGSNSSSLPSSLPSSMPSSLSKLLDQAEKAEKKAIAMGMKLLGEVALTMAQNIRGALCAICGDPDAKNTIFDPTTQTWFVNQASFDESVKQIAEAYKSTTGNGKECINMINYNKEQFEKQVGSCAAAEKLLNDLKAKLTPCQGDACSASAKACFSPIGTSCVDTVTETNDSTVARRSRRRHLATKYEPTATGGAQATPDATEDGNIQVGGQKSSTIDSNASTAETEFTAAGGSVDYKAVAAAENQSILVSFGLFVVLTISAFIL